MLKVITKVIRTYLLIAGIVINFFCLWFILGFPYYFDRWLIKSEDPISGNAIVCIAGGSTGHSLPIEQGWQRIYAAVQLYFDDYAPKIIFTGGGAENKSEAEIYAKAAKWLGCPEEAIILDPKGNSTAEHPLSILQIEEIVVNRNSALNIVTSPLHSKRVSMCFKKSGFTNFRTITSYYSKKSDLEIVRELKANYKKPEHEIHRRSQVSKFKKYRPSNKRYNDIITRLKVKTNYFFNALREIAAIAWYKIKGYA